ncbi:MAG: Gfo/Idh/MocA family oxidoreductase [Tannerella sp.]|jgi:predicted dehydrogenase|nr:Gfo/Idh/MocA family oxidoreductase [Tannerella sp.]
MTINRRTFIKSSSAMAVGMAIPPLAAAKETVGRAAASDTVNVGLIGCGEMGTWDLTDLMLHKEVRCLAMCDVNQPRLRERAGEITQIQGKQPDLYGDYRKILDRKDIDAVVIGTPDHWHCLIFADACKAGKDIYVEKPIANSIAECDAMVAAAQKYKRVVQVGQQQRSSRHFQEMIEYLRSGKLGKIGRVHVWCNFNYAADPPPVPDSKAPEGLDYDMWLGPAPKVPFNERRDEWRTHWHYGGGLMTDWGVHLLDMGLWGMDIKTMPLRVLSAGGNYLFPGGSHETYDTMSVTYQFPDFVMTWENNAGVQTGPYGKNYGFLFRGVNGTLVADREDWSVYPETNKASEITVKADHQEHAAHTSNFLECIKTRNFNTACPIENGSLCAKYAHLGNIGARLGGAALIYNDQTKKFDLDEAGKFLKPEYRSPWKFPEV